MTAMVVVLLVSLIFVLGLLVGQEYNRRCVNDGRRRLLAMRRERDELARRLAGRNEHRAG